MLLLMVAIGAKAQQKVTIGELLYQIREGERIASVCGLVKEGDSYVTENLVIPSEIEYSGKKYSVNKIGYGAFEYCNSLKSVTIPESVTEIDVQAFSDCTKLESVDIPNSVNKIGCSAFYCCESLESVVIPEFVTQIEEFTFLNCLSLKSIYFPENIESIGQYAFGDQSNLLEVFCAAPTPPVMGESAFYGISSGAVLYVPEGAGSLYENANIWNLFKRIEEISFEDEVIENVMIGELCYNLNVSKKIAEVTSLNGQTNGNYDYSNIIIPSVVEYNDSKFIVGSIGDSAFKSCPSGSIVIPKTVTKIGNSAFYDSSLTRIEIPSSVKEIGEMAFAKCYNLDLVYCKSKTPPTISENTFDPLILKYSELLVDEGCISNYNADSAWINFAKRFEKIKVGDFYYVLYPETKKAKVIFLSANEQDNQHYVSGNVVISSYFNLDGTNPNSITYEVSSIHDRAFANCTGLKSVTLPAKLTSIEISAFRDCANLESVTFSKSNDDYFAISDGAFANCTSLKSVTLPEKLTWLGNYAFEDCTNLESVTFPKDIYYDDFIQLGVFSGCRSLKSVNMPKLLQRIPSEMFNGCSSLEEVTIPNSVTKIESFAFYGCSSLEQIVIPDSVSSIEYMAFRDCSSLESVEIPNSVTFIGPSAFQGCSSLESIVIPNSVKIVGSGAFSLCESLKSASLPNSLLSIPTELFNRCSSLEQIVIPDSVTSIESSAFLGCNSIKSVTIPASVTSIQDFAFVNCNSLETIYCKAQVPPIAGYYVFDAADNSDGDTNTHDTATLYVPVGTVSEYSNAECWSRFKLIEEKQYNSAIGELAATENVDVIGYYNMQGVKSSEPWPGINIVIYSDGSNRKIFNK